MTADSDWRVEAGVCVVRAGRVLSSDASQGCTVAVPARDTPMLVFSQLKCFYKKF